MESQQEGTQPSGLPPRPEPTPHRPLGTEAALVVESPGKAGAAGSDDTGQGAGSPIAEAALTPEEAANRPAAGPPGQQPPSYAGAGTADEPEAGRVMSYGEHLEELRARLIKSVVALVVSMAISFTFTWNVIDLLKRPAGDVKFIFTEPAEQVGMYMQVAFFTGIVLSTPVWLYQLIRFVAPGLTGSERRFVLTALPAILACFITGAAFGFFVLIPPMLNFLYHFGEQVAEPNIRLGRHVTFVATMVFLMGMMFETPLIIYLLARLGVVTPRRLASFRRYAVVGSFVIAAMVTPTPDPLNQTLVAGPLILLYEVGILLSRLAARARASG